MASVRRLEISKCNIFAYDTVILIRFCLGLFVRCLNK